MGYVSDYSNTLYIKNSAASSASNLEAQGGMSVYTKLASHYSIQESSTFAVTKILSRTLGTYTEDLSQYFHYYAQEPMKIGDLEPTGNYLNYRLYPDPGYGFTKITCNAECLKI